MANLCEETTTGKHSIMHGKAIVINGFWATVLGSLLVAGSVGAFANAVSTGNRMAVVETRADFQSRSLDRIEGKLDKISDRLQVRK